MSPRTRADARRPMTLPLVRHVMRFNRPTRRRDINTPLAATMASLGNLSLLTQYEFHAKIHKAAQFRMPTDTSFRE